MTQTITCEVIHVIPPDSFDDHDLQPELVELAESRFIIVCRKGGKPSFFERLWGILRLNPIKAITIVTDQRPDEGDEIQMTVNETDMYRVFETAYPKSE